MENYILLGIVTGIILYFYLWYKKKFAPKPSCINIVEVMKLIEQNQKILMVDVRTPEEFSLQHIPNSINIPLRFLKKEITKFSLDSLIIILCLKGAQRSIDGAKTATKKGFRAQHLCGGTKAWFQYQNSQNK
jgi:phage shock protein E